MTEVVRLGRSGVDVPPLGVGCDDVGRCQRPAASDAGQDGLWWNDCRCDSIDLYQHHFPSRRVDIPRLMMLMADAVEAGKVRAVGVSNYSADQMRVAHQALAERGLLLASNQVQYSLLHRGPEVDGVLTACRELGSR